MDVFAILFGSIGAAAGIGGLIIAILGERRASKSEVSAAASALAAEKAAAALERANVIAESQTQPEDAKLGDAIWVTGNLFHVKNQAGRSIVIEHVLAIPREHQNLIGSKHDLPQEISPNETFEFFAQERLSLPRPDVDLMWRWKDDDIMRTTRRMVAAR